MPIRHWIETARHSNAGEAVPSPLRKVVILKKATKAGRDALGDLLLQKGV